MQDRFLFVCFSIIIGRHGINDDDFRKSANVFLMGFSFGYHIGPMVKENNLIPGVQDPRRLDGRQSGNFYVIISNCVMQDQNRIHERYTQYFHLYYLREMIHPGVLLSQISPQSLTSNKCCHDRAADNSTSLQDKSDSGHLEPDDEEEDKAELT